MAGVLHNLTSGKPMRSKGFWWRASKCKIFCIGYCLNTRFWSNLSICWSRLSKSKDRFCICDLHIQNIFDLERPACSFYVPSSHTRIDSPSWLWLLRCILKDFARRQSDAKDFNRGCRNAKYFRLRPSKCKTFLHSRCVCWLPCVCDSSACADSCVLTLVPTPVRGSCPGSCPTAWPLTCRGPSHVWDQTAARGRLPVYPFSCLLVGPHRTPASLNATSFWIGLVLNTISFK
jgi:hypothetical protein